MERGPGSSCMYYSYVTIESSIILFKYLSISQAYVLGFQNFHTHVVWLDFCTHIDTIFNSTFDLNYILYLQIYIYNSIKYVLPLFLINLFLLSLDLW